MELSYLRELFELQLEASVSERTNTDIGSVLTIGDGIARVAGMQECMAGELLEFADGTLGMALNLEHNAVGAVLFTTAIDADILEGTIVRTTGQVVEIPVGEAYCGRIVNALCEPIDGEGSLAEMPATRPLESPAPDIMSRVSVHEPFATGITAIDAMIPIGRGQRELLIGDRQTGKSTIAIDAIINQKDCLCVYVAVGQKASTVAQIASTLSQHDSLATTVLVMSGADEPATLQFVAPYTGATVAEYFMYQGKATATIYDDLTKHAQGYREMCLLLRRPPGREAYPRRCVLPARPAPGAGREAELFARGRIDDLPADRGNPGRRRVGLHSHECHLHYGRAAVLFVGYDLRRSYEARPRIS
jgi:F-type H+/Na+-transporting ATPase subunit alpha